MYAVEGNIDGFGNFYKNEDVYSVHCPHYCVVADFFPQEEFKVETFNLVFSKLGTVDVGNIQLTTDKLAINIHSSLRGIKREAQDRDLRQCRCDGIRCDRANNSK